MKRIFYILLALILTSCTTNNVHKTLKDIETYIAERPDSALAVIEDIDTTDLTTKGLRAHHALLHAMALDKNYIDVTDDSLALKAVNYYQKRGPRKNYARALYYLALSNFRNNEHEESMYYLLKAEKIAEKHDSLYWGFVEVLLSDAYDVNYNEFEQIKCLEKALEIYTDIGAEYYVDVATLSLSSAYISNEKYEKAALLLDKLINSGKLNKKMYYQALGYYAFLMAMRPDADYKRSSEYYETVASQENGKYMSVHDYWAWAYSLSEIGNFDKSQEIVDGLKQIDTSATAYYFMYNIAKNEARTETALDYLEKFTNTNNDEVIQILKQSVSGIQRDYYQSLYTVADIKASNRIIIIISILTATIFLIGITWISIIRYKCEKEQEKENYIRYAEEVNRQLRDLKNDTYPLLQKKYISLYKSRYETLGTLFDQYVQSGGRVDSELIIYKKVVSLIDELRSDIGTFEDFEAMLDGDLDGIMTKLHTELPDLKKKDYSLFAYLTLGFDATIISHFMDCTVNTVYIRKSRLKKTIEESDSENKSLFLEIIS